MALVFEAANGASLDTIRVPGFFTYEASTISLLDHMHTIADKLQKENWVLGPAGDQSAVKQQYASLFPGILALYGKDFIAAWNAAINNLQLQAAARRPAEIPQAERRLGADFADPVRFSRSDPRRNRADARTPSRRRRRAMPRSVKAKKDASERRHSAWVT